MTRGPTLPNRSPHANRRITAADFCACSASRALAKRVAQPGSQPDRRQAGLAGSLRAGALRRPVTSTLGVVNGIARTRRNGLLPLRRWPQRGLPRARRAGAGSAVVRLRCSQGSGARREGQSLRHNNLELPQFPGCKGASNADRKGHLPGHQRWHALVSGSKAATSRHQEDRHRTLERCSACRPERPSNDRCPERRPHLPLQSRACF